MTAAPTPSLMQREAQEAPEVVARLRHIGERGGRTLALVNDATSPLALAAQEVVPLHAGPEQSVAATKNETAREPQ